MNIKELRQSGYKIKVEHFRQIGPKKFVPYSRKIKGDIKPKGGFTVVTVTNPIGETSKAVAYCSEQDQFCYKTGAQLALSRAME
jgi:hypothetical protein